MKNKILYLMVFALVSVIWTGCEKDSEGLTSTTYYASIELKGESTLYAAKGSTFTDPGFTATMAGEDVTDKVTVTNNVNTDKSGTYTISYSITNADGFIASSSRTVIVVDATDPIEGKWETNANCQRIYDGGAPTKHARKEGETFEVWFFKNEDGTYSVDDLLAGWYSQRAGYGSRYAMKGKISVAGDGTITISEGSSPTTAFGGTSKIENGKYDATATAPISYKLTYTIDPNVMVFDVELTKVDLGL